MKLHVMKVLMRVKLFYQVIIRRDRNRNGGDVALYVKNGIDFKCREDLSNVECI